MKTQRDYSDLSNPYTPVEWLVNSKGILSVTDASNLKYLENQYTDYAKYLVDWIPHMKIAANFCLSPNLSEDVEFSSHIVNDLTGVTHTYRLQVNTDFEKKTVNVTYFYKDDIEVGVSKLQEALYIQLGFPLNPF